METFIMTLLIGLALGISVSSMLKGKSKSAGNGEDFIKKDYFDKFMLHMENLFREQNNFIQKLFNDTKSSNGQVSKKMIESMQTMCESQNLLIKRVDNIGELVSELNDGKRVSRSEKEKGEEYDDSTVDGFLSKCKHFIEVLVKIGRMSKDEFNLTATVFNILVEKVGDSEDMNTLKNHVETSERVFNEEVGDRKFNNIFTFMKHRLEDIMSGDPINPIKSFLKDLGVKDKNVHTIEAGSISEVIESITKILKEKESELKGKSKDDIEPVKDEPVKDEPVKDEPVKDEPVKGDKSKTEDLSDSIKEFEDGMSDITSGESKK